MSQYIIFINTAFLLTSIFLFNYHSQYSIQNKLKFFIHKIKNLEQEINDILVDLDILEEKFDVFQKKFDKTHICTLKNNVEQSQTKTCLDLDYEIINHHLQETNLF